MKSFFSFCILLCSFVAQAQTYEVKLLAQAPSKSIRGLSAVDDNVVWISGTEGKVGRSLNGGKDWEWFTVSGCDTCDFRDIEAFSATRAVIMSIAEPAMIYVTEDGGQHWERTYFNATPGMFLDGMDFWDHQNGVAVGDPIDGIFTILYTNDGGNSWYPTKGPAAKDGEASFAASGTTIRMTGMNSFVMCSGGMVSRLFHFNPMVSSVDNIPGTQGTPARGMFSIAFRDGKRGIAVGGDYTSMALTEGNCLLTKDGGRHWKAPETLPRGYRSSVEYLNDHILVATGPTGTDISNDGGLNWKALSDEGFHVARKAKNGMKVFLAGSKGRIAVMDVVAGNIGL